MKLYNFDPSLSPLKVRLALAELNLDYETLTINLFKGEQKKPSFLTISSRGKVPVFQDAGTTFVESNSIVTYLGREYGTGYWPKGNDHVALEWLFLEASIAPHCGALWFNDTVSRVMGREQKPDEVMDAHVDSLVPTLDYLNLHFERNQFCLENDFSLVDCVMGTTLNALKGTRIDDRTRWEFVTEYRDRIRSRKSWAAARGDSIFQPKLAL